MNEFIQKPIISANLIEYCINPSDLEKLDGLSLKECRQILSFLTRIWIRNTCADDDNNNTFKLSIFEKLRQFEDTNRICEYLNANFSQIYDDVIRHLSARFELY